VPRLLHEAVEALAGLADLLGVVEELTLLSPLLQLDRLPRFDHRQKL
jgi:hypothetical protein